MTQNIKKGDRIIIIDKNFIDARYMLPDGMGREFLVEYRKTSRYNGRTYVSIKEDERSNRRIPIECVMKVNTKLLKLKEKIMGGKTNEV